MASTGERGSAPPESSETKLSDSTGALARIVRDLEAQLDRVLETNDVLKQELDAERKRRLSLERTVDDLHKELEHRDVDAAATQNQLSELDQLRAERTRLAAELREARTKLDDVVRAQHRDEELVGRLRRAREEALEEVQSVERQFDRAMHLVDDLRARLAVLGEERDALEGQLMVVEQKLLAVEDERDLVRQEVRESRAALDEIRRALVDACIDEGELAELAGGRSGARG